MSATDTAATAAGTASEKPVGTASPDAKSEIPPSKDGQKEVRKDSTIELPMFDLQEAINFVSTIHDKALETAAMPEVAKSMGYSHASSTPFYRRTVAARLFGLISKTGVELTQRSRDYLKPDREDGKVQALRDAALGIPAYADKVAEFANKRLNVTFIANGFSKAFNLTDGCALTCAKAFEGTLKAAGMLTGENIVTVNGVLPQAPAQSNGGSASPTDKGDVETDDTQTHTLYLDKTKTRKFTVTSPLDMNEGEISRIKKWLEITLLMDWKEQ